MNRDKRLTALILAAGEGTRFRQEGWTTPKPLLEVDNKPLIIHAAENIDCNLVSEYVFAVRQEHIDNFHIDLVIKRFYPKARIVAFNQTTKGPLDTCYKVRQFVKPGSLIVLDCDLKFHSSDLESLLKLRVDSCVLVSFHSRDPRYSYALQDSDSGKVIEVVEKNPVSDKALCGAYYFPDTSDFFRLAKEQVEKTEGQECYLSSIYKEIIKNQDIKLVTCDMYKSYGTPEEFLSNV